MTAVCERGFGLHGGVVDTPFRGGKSKTASEAGLLLRGPGCKFDVGDRCPEEERLSEDRLGITLLLRIHASSSARFGNDPPLAGRARFRCDDNAFSSRLISGIRSVAS